MNEIIVKEVNSKTGEEIERKATASEIQQIATDKAESEAEKTAIAEKAAIREAVLAKLGLTEDEMAALRG